MIASRAVTCAILFAFNVISLPLSTGFYSASTVQTPGRLLTNSSTSTPSSTLILSIASSDGGILQSKLPIFKSSSTSRHGHTPFPLAVPVGFERVQDSNLGSAGNLIAPADTPLQAAPIAPAPPAPAPPSSNGQDNTQPHTGSGKGTPNGKSAASSESPPLKRPLGSSPGDVSKSPQLGGKSDVGDLHKTPENDTPFKPNGSPNMDHSPGPNDTPKLDSGPTLNSPPKSTDNELKNPAPDSNPAKLVKPPTSDFDEVAETPPGSSSPNLPPKSPGSEVFPEQLSRPDKIPEPVKIPGNGRVPGSGTVPEGGEAPKLSFDPADILKGRVPDEARAVQDLAKQSEVLRDTATKILNNEGSESELTRVLDETHKLRQGLSDALPRDLSSSGKPSPGSQTVPGTGGIPGPDAGRMPPGAPELPGPAVPGLPRPAVPEIPRPPTPELPRPQGPQPVIPEVLRPAPPPVELPHMPSMAQRPPMTPEWIPRYGRIRGKLPPMIDMYGEEAAETAAQKAGKIAAVDRVHAISEADFLEGKGSHFTDYALDGASDPVDATKGTVKGATSGAGSLAKGVAAEAGNAVTGAEAATEAALGESAVTGAKQAAGGIAREMVSIGGAALGREAAVGAGAEAALFAIDTGVMAVTTTSLATVITVLDVVAGPVGLAITAGAIILDKAIRWITKLVKKHKAEKKRKQKEACAAIGGRTMSLSQRSSIHEKRKQKDKCKRGVEEAYEAQLARLDAWDDFYKGEITLLENVHLAATAW